MKDVLIHRTSILFAAAAMTVGSFTFLATSLQAQQAPADSAKAVDRAADKTIDAANQTKAAAEQMKMSNVAMLPAPAAEEIRDTLAATTEAAVTKGGFTAVVKHLVDADRTRLANYTPSDGFSKLDGRIDSFQKDWKSKYGQEFSFSKGANTILGDSFARISQGEIGEAQTAAGKEVASNEPKVVAGSSQELKKSGVSNTDANSGKTFGGDTKKEVGRNIATVLLPASAHAPELAIPLIHELPNSWQIDLPDSIDGQRLHENLLKYLTKVDEDRANWPADVNEAYRIVTRQVMTAIMESSSPRASL